MLALVNFAAGAEAHRNKMFAVDDLSGHVPLRTSVHRPNIENENENEQKHDFKNLFFLHFFIEQIIS